MNGFRNPYERAARTNSVSAATPARRFRRYADIVAHDLSDLMAVMRFVVFSDEKSRRQVSEAICLPAGPVGARRRKARPVRKLIIFLAMVSVSRVAVAQEQEIITPVQLFDEETGPGVPISPGAILHASLETELVHDTNVYSRSTPEISDTLAVIRPNLSISTDLGRHYATLSTGGEFRRYFDITDEDSDQYWLNANARLDLGERLTLTTDGLIAQRVLQRGTAGDTFLTDRPMEYLEKRAGAELSRTGGTLELIGGFNVSRRKYDDATFEGAPVDLSFRDATSADARIRANYRVSENLQLFTRLTGNTVDYDDDTGVSRDSEGFGLIGGVEFRPSNLTDVQVGVGYIRQTYDDPSVGTTSGLNYYVNANWVPTPKLRVTAMGERRVDPSPISNIPAIVRSDFDLRVQRALGDRLLVEAGATYANEDYQSIDRKDDSFAARLGVRARVTERLGASAFVSYRKRDSVIVDRDFNGASFGVSLRYLL